MKAKKSLGQNFLKSVLALHKIVEAGEVNTEDVVLEIGPGKGALTKKILERSGKVIAVEKDYELFQLLQEKFKAEIAEGKLKLISGDILEFNPQEQGFKKGEYKIVANIPYNITGAILKKFLTDEAQPSKMVLMVQKEVAHRIVAGDKKESILSISVKAYGKPSFVMKVPARYFSPAPKVDSAVILIDDISREIFTKTGASEEKFWEIVKTGFAHKRKKLSGNLKNMNFIEKEEFMFLKNKRAEDLSLEQWISLAKLS